jgi:hypothetical protein
LLKLKQTFQQIQNLKLKRRELKLPLLQLLQEEFFRFKVNQPKEHLLEFLLTSFRIFLNALKNPQLQPARVLTLHSQQLDQILF